MSKSSTTNNTRKNVTQIESRLLRSRIVEDFIVIWLDSTINETNEDTHNSILQLQNIVNSFKAFRDPNQCIDFITNGTYEKVFFIISGSFGHKLVPLIENITQINSIYVFCRNRQINEQWASKHHKVTGVFTQIQSICDALKQDVRQSESTLTPISIVTTASSTNMNELDQSFMYSQLLKEILLELPHDPTSKKKLVDFCRVQYADNLREIQVIDEFERDYDHPSPIWWYTRECFTYSMLNKALRTQDIEIIIKMGFFIRDLHRQIQQLHAQSSSQQPFIVYRGQGMLNEEFQKLKRSKGCLLSFNNFLSTSVGREVSMGFARRARNNPDLTPILFQIKVDPSISSTPFASLDKISYYADREKEILFSMHTVFRIGEIKETENRLWEVSLTLTSDNDQQLDQLTQQMRKEIRGTTGLHRMGQLMIRMGHFNKAEEIYIQSLQTISDDDDPADLAHIHHQLGSISNEKGDLSSALSHYQQSLDIRLIYQSLDDPQLSPTYCNIGAILQQQGDLGGALEHFERALNIDLHAPKPNQHGIVALYNNIGAVLTGQGKYAEALKNYELALEVVRSYVSPHHPSLAITYSNIGGVYLLMGDKSTTLSYLEKTLEIQQKCYPPNHPSLSISHTNMGDILEDLHRYREAIDHAKRAIDIAQDAFGSDHNIVKLNQNKIDRLRRKL
jgi:tetratricopeptide (TPR) repeat protein